MKKRAVCICIFHQGSFLLSTAQHVKHQAEVPSWGFVRRKTEQGAVPSAPTGGDRECRRESRGKNCDSQTLPSVKTSPTATLSGIMVPPGKKTLGWINAFPRVPQTVYATSGCLGSD